MRIIDQNGCDYPYESIVISHGDGMIYARPVSNMEKQYFLARYSTEEKADKAMLLLHKIYVKAPLENEAKEMGEFVRGTFKAIGTSGYVEPESNYFVLRFPREDEL